MLKVAKTTTQGPSMTCERSVISKCGAVSDETVLQQYSQDMTNVGKIHEPHKGTARNDYTQRVVKILWSFFKSFMH